MNWLHWTALIFCTTFFMGCYSPEVGQQIGECKELPEIGVCSGHGHGAINFECRERDICLLKLAKEHSISQLCYEIDPSYKVECLQSVAINTHNPGLCIQGEEERGEEYARCLAEASEYSLWSCDRISNQDVKNICVHEVAFQNMDYDLCSKILDDSYSLGQCQVQIKNGCLRKYLTKFPKVRSSICLNYSKTYEECQKFYPNTWEEVSSFFNEYPAEYTAYCFWVNEQCNVEC
ncbi:MAG: hypothetical protein ABII71_01505 [Candidatus Micrarchaeota archaeon]